MIQRELIHWVFKIIVLFICLLFRVLLGGDKRDIGTGFNQENNRFLKKTELIKEMNSEFILSDNIVCGSE